ncbi:hypothetical protein CHS0354_043110 [Potamilus streckersoni]|uniref:Uncharacterized protein n=1 Tax=Potamilus streckersoni TaxID=2493646 RepID=A0AAE0VSF9_9BIVA|nr:hypothetical protein CHS0354_043110 [Potamilus streckersoni]
MTYFVPIKINAPMQSPNCRGSRRIPLFVADTESLKESDTDNFHKFRQGIRDANEKHVQFCAIGADST